MNKKQNRQINQFMKGGRYKRIKQIKEYALKNNLCKEKIDGMCTYPHCGCLFKTLSDISEK